MHKMWFGLSAIFAVAAYFSPNISIFGPNDNKSSTSSYPPVSSPTVPSAIPRTETVIQDPPRSELTPTDQSATTQSVPNAPVSTDVPFLSPVQQVQEPAKTDSQRQIPPILDPPHNLNAETPAPAPLNEFGQPAGASGVPAASVATSQTTRTISNGATHIILPTNDLNDKINLLNIKIEVLSAELAHRDLTPKQIKDLRKQRDKLMMQRSDLARKQLGLKGY